MAKKNAFLHVGPDLGGEPLHDAFSWDPSLAAARVAAPGVRAEELALADLEIRRAHRSAGLRRRDVEGAWARVCRKADRAGTDVVISQPDWLALSPEQAALAADGLGGFRLHVVVTPPDPVAVGSAASLAGPWAGLVGRKGGVHLLPVGRDLSAEGLAQAIALLALELDHARAERKLAKIEKRLRAVGRGRDVEAAPVSRDPAA